MSIIGKILRKYESDNRWWIASVAPEVSEQFSQLFDKYVPDDGYGKTKGAEALRRTGWIIHNLLNNGDYPNESENLDTDIAILNRLLIEGEGYLFGFSVPRDKNEKLLFIANQVKKVVEILKSHSEYFKEPYDNSEFNYLTKSIEAEYNRRRNYQDLDDMDDRFL